MAAQETSKTSKKTEAIYVVQQKGGEGRWDDIATVKMPPRSRRKRVIEKALADHPPSPSAMLTVRVLDEASAKAIPVKAKQQTSLEIG